MPIPSYNHFVTTASPIFRHSTTSAGIESGKMQVKSESTASNPIVISEVHSLGKIQGMSHNTSEHVQELNQMCLTKDPKEFDKNIMSELKMEFLMSR